MTLDTVKLVELLEIIIRRTPLDAWCLILLEIISLSLLESNLDEECIAHFRKEKAVRGDYTRQIQDFEKSAIKHDTEFQQQSGASVNQNEVRPLPGLVSSYDDVPVNDYYHELLYSYAGAN